MDNYIDKLPGFVDTIKSIEETIITNIVLIGQTPAPYIQRKKTNNHLHGKTGRISGR